jgi:release factor glutamine methyltransferase
VDRAVRRLRRRRNPVMVDVCTGAGPIALAVADEVPHAQVWGADIADEGLAQGRRNARTLGVRNVSFRRGDMYDPLPARLRGNVDVITGHIPYVPSHELDDLPAEVREFEPAYTLTDETDEGLFLIRRAALEAPEWLKHGGWILLEVSEDLAGAVRKICRKAGLENAEVASDEDRLSVVVEARLERRRRGREF